MSFWSTPRALLMTVVMKLTPSPIPFDVADLIVDHYYGTVKQTASSKTRQSHTGMEPYYTPPARCLLLEKLPAEIRVQIWSYSLPENSRNAMCVPICNDDASKVVAPSKKPTRAPRGRIVDMMVLHSKIRNDIAQVLYEERWFNVHVHEGLQAGGVEFKQGGRQPLQFIEGFCDTRFKGFTRDSDFGFDRLKKIRIEIHQAQVPDRHTAINTYFINLALCRLLDRPGSEANRIKYIEIDFVKSTKVNEQVGRRAIQRIEEYWWDADTLTPRSTSIHNVSNIELVLRPFANLTRCHNVTILIPSKLADHMPTATFVSRLESSMKSTTGSLFLHDELERNIEIAKFAMEEYVRNLDKSKQTGVVVEDLKETELLDDVGEEIFDQSDLEDEIEELPPAAPGTWGDPAPVADAEWERVQKGERLPRVSERRSARRTARRLEAAGLGQRKERLRADRELQQAIAESLMSMDGEKFAATAARISAEQNIAVYDSSHNKIGETIAASENDIAAANGDDIAAAMEASDMTAAEHEEWQFEQALKASLAMAKASAADHTINKKLPFQGYEEGDNYLYESGDEGEADYEEDDNDDVLTGDYHVPSTPPRGRASLSAALSAYQDDDEDEDNGGLLLGRSVNTPLRAGTSAAFTSPSAAAHSGDESSPFAKRSLLPPKPSLDTALQTAAIFSTGHFGSWGALTNNPPHPNTVGKINDRYGVTNRSGSIPTPECSAETHFPSPKRRAVSSSVMGQAGNVVASTHGQGRAAVARHDSQTGEAGEEEEEDLMDLED